MAVNFTQSVTSLRRRLVDAAKEVESITKQGQLASEDSNELNNFKGMYKVLDKYFERFETLWDQLCDLHEQESKPLDFPKDTDKSVRVSVKKYYYRCNALFESLCKEQTVTTAAHNVTLSDTSLCQNLPRISLPKFDGQIINWPKFRDTFMSLVHNETSLTSMQKFHYLTSSISGSALTVVSHLPMQEANYKIAWDALLQTYDNKRMLAAAYLNKLIHFKPLVGKQSCDTYKYFLSKVADNIAAFKLLNIENESEYILFHLAIRCLDSSTREQFEMSHKDIDFPNFTDLIKFVRQRSIALELAGATSRPYDSPTNKTGSLPKPFTPSRSNKIALLTETPVSKPTSSIVANPTCIVCHESPHKLLSCLKFTSMNANQRLHALNSWKGCRNCLSYNHKTAECSSKWHCRFCKFRHHSLLHLSSPTSMPLNLRSESSKSDHATIPVSVERTSLSSTGLLSGDIQVLLGTAMAFIHDHLGNLQTIRMVIDSGSQNSFITSSCAQRLGLPINKCDQKICGIGQMPLKGESGFVLCTLTSSTKMSPILKTEAVVVNIITNKLPTAHLPTSVCEEYQRFQLADPSFWIPGDIDFLLGADLFCEVLLGPPVTLHDHIPKLIPSVFGHVVVGKYQGVHGMNADHTSLLVRTDSSKLSEQLHEFWEIEEPLTPARPLTLEDETCEQHFLDTHSRDEHGRYVVRLPFKDMSPVLGESSSYARKRLINLEKRLDRHPELNSQYKEFMQEYLDLGHMTLTDSNSKFVIPHHAVLKEDRNKRKLRVVFDASLRTSNRQSLNDCLLSGPKLQNDLRDILTNFRAHSVVFVADLVKMYRSILVHPDDRCYQHIFWRFDVDCEVKTYELNTVTYGLSSAPYLALRVLHQLVLDEGSKFPEASRAIEEDMYIDDLVTGCDSVAEGLELKKQVVEIFALAGFSLSKWASNSEEFIKTVPDMTEATSPKSLSKEDQNFKILGLQWNPKDDTFGYKIALQDQSITKRGILSTIAKLYDPLGFLTPTVFLMKTFMQELWKEGLDWDKPVPDHLSTPWMHLLVELPQLSEIQIPRFIGFSEKYEYQIVGFSDASSKGYCAVLYIRCISGHSTKISLLTAKSRLAPLKTISIPRLELCGALLLSRLYYSLKSFLRTLKGQGTDPYFFTDSTIVLGWIHTPAFKLNTFVANRVTEIVEKTPQNTWRHVCSDHNPSDCGSRGLTPSQLLGHPLWWSGPHWLENTCDNWPLEELSVSEVLPEMKTVRSTLISTPTKSPFVLFIERFSSYTRLLRTVAWILRFISNCRNRSNKIKGTLTRSELKISLFQCVKHVQLHYFFEGNLGNLKKVLEVHHKLHPFLDEAGILRVGGRLRYSDLPYDQKFPIFLPKKCSFTTLLIDYYHIQYLHPGPTLLQALIQQRFWIPALRRLVYQRIFQCVKCYRLKATPLIPIMADLPNYRVTGGKAFQHVGTDFGGPFRMRESLRRKAPETKVYLCLFVCMATKALHLELVTSLTTEAFLACLDRFVSRRGLPSNIYSDCGTNYIGAARQLQDLQGWLHEERTKTNLIDYASSKGIHWHFNPPHAPHFGGLWEAGIKSVKRLLRTNIGENVLTHEELMTYLLKIEAILNSRPLCPLSNAPEDFDYLTPGHFIIGGPLVAIPEPSLLNLKENTLSRWQLVKMLSEHFWKRWRLEYLTTLQQRSKWTKNCKDLEEGDLVLLKEDNVPPLKWPLARVVSTHPGRDGRVRVATVRTSSSSYKRPTCKLVPFPPSQNSQSEEEFSKLA